MKPQEILAMIEEAAGTMMYESKKNIAIKTIHRKEEKIKEINSIIDEELTPTLNRLREERTEYLQYQKSERELEHLNRQYVAYKFVSIEQATEKVKEEFEELKREKENYHVTGGKWKAEIEALEKEIVSLQQQRDTEGGQQLATLEANLKTQERAETKAQSAVKMHQETIKSEEKKKVELIKNLEFDKAALMGIYRDTMKRNTLNCKKNNFEF